MSHWATRYIGRAWANGGSGPEAYDCWGFVRSVYRERYGITLPAVQVDADLPLAVRHRIARECVAVGWSPVAFDQLVEGDVLLLSQARHPNHVGIWLDLEAVLHCVRGAGVIAQDFRSLELTGWNLVSAYRWGPA